MPSQDTISSDFQDFGISHALRDASTVKRTSRVDYIGDTHGNYEGFLFNMGKLGLLDMKGNWIGKKRRLVLLGDIYADRNLGSLQTAQHIEKLRAQGAQIEQLAGNHEDVMVSYFDHAHTPEISAVSHFCAGYLLEDGPEIDEFSGLQELATFKKGIKHPSWQNLLIGTQTGALLKRMRTLKKGQTVLSNICRLQIGKIIDDTLFIHTDPVDGMMTMFEKYDWDIEKVNDLFRAYLVQTLQKGEIPERDALREVLGIRRCFLDVDNRRTDEKNRPLLSHGVAQKIKTKLKIRRIIHGHTDHHSEQTIFRGELEITSADNSSFKGGNRKPWNNSISAGSILPNGHRVGPRP